MRISHRRASLSAGVLIVALALAGCASVASSSPVPEPSGSSRPSPSATPSATPLSSDPVDWVITIDGVGPLTLGGSLTAEVPATAPAYTADADGTCPNPSISILKSDANPTIWIQAASEGSDEVAMIAVGGDGSTTGWPHTAEGITVGSSLAQLQAAYPTGELEGEQYQQVFVVAETSASGDDRYLLFELFEDVVFTIFVQTDPTHQYELCG